MEAEGLDAGVLDMDPNSPAPGAGPAAKRKSFKLPLKKPTGPRMKPLYWDKVDPKAGGHLLWMDWATAKDDEAAEKIDAAEKQVREGGVTGEVHVCVRLRFVAVGPDFSLTRPSPAVSALRLLIDDGAALHPTQALEKDHGEEDRGSKGQGVLGVRLEA